MPRPWRLRFAGAKYHLTQRGNGGQAVFLGADDYGRFLEQLDHCLEANGVKLYAYCLMPNHYHLLAETPLGNVQRFMQRLNTSYAMYFRYKHTRPGHCWQGRYGAKLVKADEYILRVTRYIHLNPIKVQAFADRPRSELLEHLDGWLWSSYAGYAGLRWPEDSMPGMETVERAVMEEFRISREALHSHGQHAGEAKSVAIELCCRLSGASQRDVGRYFGYRTDGGVTKQRQRLALLADPQLATRMERLADALSKYIVQV